jgi:two-component system, LuxR family, sensor kinase FixL
MLTATMSKSRTPSSSPARNPRPVDPPLPSSQSEAQLRAILDHAVEGIIVIDEQGMIETFNKAAQRMFGYEASEVVGHNVSMLMPEPFGAQHDHYMRKYHETGHRRIIGIGREAVGKKKNGAVFPVDLSISEVRVDGKLTYTGLVRDITERKRLEREVLDVSEREQRRIGYDLHDGVCQELAGVAFLAQTMETRLAAGNRVTAEDAAEIRKLLQEAVSHARALSRGLQPVDPQPGGLAAALRQLATDTSDCNKISCQFCGDHGIDLADKHAATHVYRIAQEAIRDAIQHGKATCIAIDLSTAKGIITLTVVDNGVGLGEDGRYREEMVMRMMHHRARVIGAELSICPRWPGGVKVACELPNQSNQQRAAHV